MLFKFALITLVFVAMFIGGIFAVYGPAKYCFKFWTDGTGSGDAFDKGLAVVCHIILILEACAIIDVVTGTSGEWTVIFSAFAS